MYLRQGKLVAVRRKARSSPTIEFFWLCGDCARHLNLEVGFDGEVGSVSCPPLLSCSSDIPLTPDTKSKVRGGPAAKCS